MLALALLTHLALGQGGDAGPAVPSTPGREVGPGGSVGAVVDFITDAALGRGGDGGPPIPSIWSAEPLRGGSVAAAWAGFAHLGLAYAQGVTEVDDLGASLDLDWATTELRLSGLYRRPMGTLGGWDVAGRIGVGWYTDMGSTWVRKANRGDRGIDLAPAVTLSTPAAGGTFSITAEVPLTLTLWHDGGALVRPRAWIGYEAALWSDVALGARAMVGWRKGLGDAPLSGPSADLGFLLTATYRVF